MKFIHFIFFYSYPAHPSNSPPPPLSFSLYPVIPRYNCNPLLRLHTATIPVVYLAILVVANPTSSNNPSPAASACFSILINPLRRRLLPTPPRLVIAVSPPPCPVPPPAESGEKIKLLEARSVNRWNKSPSYLPCLVVVVAAAAYSHDISIVVTSILEARGENINKKYWMRVVDEQKMC